MKTLRLSILTDYPDWLDLAKEVESLFGPMVDEPAFCDGLRTAILEKNALCVVEGERGQHDIFHGGIIISKESNEIVWFAVARQNRGQGIGGALLSDAINRLDRTRPITVTTFDQTVTAGASARNLYRTAGFSDTCAAGLNPAGIPIVIMTLKSQNENADRG